MPGYLPARAGTRSHRPRGAPTRSGELAPRTELDLGLILPCNVIVYEADDGGTVVAAFDPEVGLGLVANPALEPIAREAKDRLRNTDSRWPRHSSHSRGEACLRPTWAITRIAPTSCRHRRGETV
ncbi:MAG: DUF302 domain-containing protein [Chloroflexi bacterium]|nr:DUF302 domain-containing protein [Chloroflexota bacterium]